MSRPCHQRHSVIQSMVLAFPWALPAAAGLTSSASVESQPWRHYVRTSPYRLEVAAPSGRNPWQCDCSPVSDLWGVRNRCAGASVVCRSWSRLLVLYNMWPDLGNALDEGLSFQLVARRQERGSLLIITNQLATQWDPSSVTCTRRGHPRPAAPSQFIP
jgi:hypothetical protein